MANDYARHRFDLTVRSDLGEEVTARQVVNMVAARGMSCSLTDGLSPPGVLPGSAGAQKERWGIGNSTHCATCGQAWQRGDSVVVDASGARHELPCIAPDRWRCPCCGGPTSPATSANAEPGDRICAMCAPEVDAWGDDWWDQHGHVTALELEARESCAVKGQHAPPAPAVAPPPTPRWPDGSVADGIRALGGCSAPVPGGFCTRPQGHSARHTMTDGSGRVIAWAANDGDPPPRCAKTIKCARPPHGGECFPDAFDTLADLDRKARRVDHRGSRAPCVRCGLRACWHPRDKAGW